MNGGCVRSRKASWWWVSSCAHTKSTPTAPLMVKAAHAVSRMKHGKLASFYQRIKMKKGGQVALVALARKMLTIIWHLLKNKEKYIDEDYEKKVKISRQNTARKMSLKEMAQILRSAGYIVTEQT